MPSRRPTLVPVLVALAATAALTPATQSAQAARPDVRPDTRLAPSVASAGGTAAVGHPSLRVLRDARRDVTVDDDSPAGQPRPGHREGDIRAVRVHHGEEAVRISVRFAALGRPTGPSSGLFLATVRTPTTEFATGAVTEAQRPQGTTWIEDGGDFACAGLTSRVRYGVDRLTLRVPRRCLGRPDWVRVSFSALTGGGGTVYSDTVPGRSLASTRLGPRAWAPGA